MEDTLVVGLDESLAGALADAFADPLGSALAAILDPLFVPLWGSFLVGLDGFFMGSDALSGPTTELPGLQTRLFSDLRGSDAEL